MSLEYLLRAVTTALRSAGIPAMLTGSVAAGFRGAGRATMDIDLVIDPTAVALDRFVESVQSQGLYVSMDAAREALANRTMFNVVDPDSGWKADLIVRKDRSFSRAEFERREHSDFLGIPLAVATLEDVILSKLEWARLGGSERQFDDVRALLRVAGDTLDRAYLERWVDPLGLRAEWETVVE